MTPTEQDKELKSQLDKIFPCDCGFTKGFAFKQGDPCDGTCVNAPYKKAVRQLITADRKRVALEARIDELERAKSLYQRTYKQEVTDNGGNIYVNDSHGYISSYEVQERIAELKAQQEDE